SMTLVTADAGVVPPAKTARAAENIGAPGGTDTMPPMDPGAPDFILQTPLEVELSVRIKVTPPPLGTATICDASFNSTLISSVELLITQKSMPLPAIKVV